MYLSFLRYDKIQGGKTGIMNIIPWTCILKTSELIDSNEEFSRLMKESSKIKVRKSSITWIIKPANANRGNGIFLARNVDEIIKKLQRKKKIKQW